MKKKIRTKEVGLISAVTILSQVIAGNVSTRNLSEDLNKVHLEIANLRIERAEYYVNKSDFNILGLKVDKANEQLQTLKAQTSSLKNFLKANLHYNYSFMPQAKHASNKFGLLKKTQYDN
jgi:hypothetical protein